MPPFYAARAVWYLLFRGHAARRYLTLTARKIVEVPLTSSAMIPSGLPSAVSSALMKAMPSAPGTPAGAAQARRWWRSGGLIRAASRGNCGGSGLHLLADFEDFVGIFDKVIGQLADVDETT